MGHVSAVSAVSVYRRATATIALLMLAGATLVSTQAPAATPGAHRLKESYGQFPLHFEQNAGQADPRTDFLARGKGYNLFLTPRGAVLGLRTGDGAKSTVLRLNLAGANARARATASDPLPGRINYFIGNDPAKWRTNLPTYGRVQYGEVYPGIDLTYYGNQGQLEYDFIVAPGADLTKIAMSFEGVQSMDLDRNGDLILRTSGGEVRQHQPVVYQEIEGVRRAVTGRYLIAGKRRVGFDVGAYDETLPLVIDPVLVYSTYLGGSGSLAEQGNAIAVDGAGNAYITGVTGSTDFPVASGEDPSSNGGTDAFVSKLSADGLTLMYSTYLGGGLNDDGRGLAVDAVGNAYVTGFARNGFPTTPGAYDTTIGGIVTMDAFVAKLDAAGELVYSTFLGGASNDEGKAIAVDGSGNAYVTGLANAGFPTTPGVVDTTASGTEVFVTRLNSTGTGPLLYSTFLGGLGNDDGRGIAVDAAGNVYVTGVAASAFPWTPGAYDTTFGGSTSDAFVSKLNPSATALLYSTFLGGPGVDDGRGIAVDAAGNAYVTGLTDSDLTTTTGAFDTIRGGRDAYVAKFDATGTTALYLTYVGGAGADDGRGIAVDADGKVHLTGQTASTPSGPFQPTPGAADSTPGGATDAFITTLILGSSGAQDLVYSMYLGGGADEAGNGIAVDPDGNAYVTGVTSSTDFPGFPVAGFDLTHNGGNDAFATKLSARVITLTLDPASATLDFGADHQLVVTAHDEHDNLAAGVKVRFSVNGTPSGFITTDSNGQGIFEYSGPPTPATDTITAYPDANNNGEPDAFEVSASATAAFSAQTTTAVVSSDNPSRVGQLVTFTATVSPVAPGAGTPSGSVQFVDNGTAMGAPAALGNGMATMSTSALTVGPHAITVQFLGGGNFDGSAGTVTQTVNPAAGRMTGGGMFASHRVHYTFTLRCDSRGHSQRFEVRWGKGNKFRLEQLTSAACVDDPKIESQRPAAGFDTIHGAGTGLYDGASATAVWTFTDAGEPGKEDTASIVIRDAAGHIVLSVSGSISNGNHQAH
jgi:hypothetical protein